MPFASATDGTRLAYRETGAGQPLLCLPGGPMLDSAYLGDLGGLDRHRRLVLLDPRGTGASDPSPDPAAYRCDRMAEDVEALRIHLGLERVDLLGHSAGANLAYRYAEHHPERVSRLVLVAPSPRGVGVEVPDAARQAIVESRADEPGYGEAVAAYRNVLAGTATDADWAAMSPLSYGRWDEEVRAWDAWMDQRRHLDLVDEFVAGYDPPTTRAAMAALDTPVVVLAGQVDVGNPPSSMAEIAGLFPRAELVVQPGAGHFPWVDDTEAFVALLVPHLA
jgi:pimeloyl-ACP methyl ester carboxylesterase